MAVLQVIVCAEHGKQKILNAVTCWRSTCISKLQKSTNKPE
jgi:hypothetical protein